MRRRGYSKEDAEELTQGFFSRFLKRNYLAGLSSERGRFRAFLLSALKHFLANERERAGRQKRGGGDKPLSLDWQDAETRYQIEPADFLSPDRLYDRAWAVMISVPLVLPSKVEKKRGWSWLQPLVLLQSA